MAGDDRNADRDIRDLYGDMWLRVLADFVDAMLDAVIHDLNNVDTPLSREQAIEAIERVRTEFVDGFRGQRYDTRAAADK